MNAQLSLDLAARRESDAQAHFHEWASVNKHIVEWIEHEALRLKRAGFQHYSVKTLWEVARHHTALNEGPGSKWKLNNSWTSRVARLLIERRPELDGFFELRRLHGV